MVVPDARDRDNGEAAGAHTPAAAMRMAVTAERTARNAPTNIASLHAPSRCIAARAAMVDVNPARSARPETSMSVSSAAE